MCTVTDSLEYFLGLFNQRLKKSEQSNDINERVDILIKDITISFYEKISRGLFEKDKLLYSFMIVVSKLQNDNVIKGKDWQFFLRGAGSFNPKIDQDNIYYTANIQKFLDMEKYIKFLSFKENCDDFKTIAENICNPPSDSKVKVNIVNVNSSLKNKFTDFSHKI